MFDAPIPGQSLTRAPGSRPYEQPPLYNDPEEATVAMLDALTNKKSAPIVAAMLDKGIPATFIATGLLKQGVAEGKWSVDTAMLIGKRALGAVVAVGHGAGVKNIVYAPDKEDKLSDIVNSKGFRPHIKDEELDMDITRAPEESEPQPPMSDELGEDITENPERQLPNKKPMSKGMEEDMTSGPGGSMMPSYGKQRPLSKDLGEDKTTGRME